MGWPEHLWDPTQYELRLRRLALGLFVVDHRQTFVYERYDPDVERIDRQKTFMVLPMGGVPGRLIDVPGTSEVEHEPTEFNHVRYQAILRQGSLRDWWMTHGHPDEVRYAFTDPDGRILAVRQTLFEESIDIGPESA